MKKLTQLFAVSAVLLLIAASAAVFWYFIRKFEKAGLSLSGNFFEALSNKGKLYTVLRWVFGGILCAGSALLFMGSELDANVTFLRVLAGFGLLSGISFPLLLSSFTRCISSCCRISEQTSFSCLMSFRSALFSA